MIILKNNSQNKLVIASLAVELDDNDTIELDYYDISLLLNNDELKSLYDAHDISFFFDSTEINYEKFINIISPVTKENHETIISNRHPDCISYSEIEKDSNGLTSHIYYYSDSLKTNKIKEEIINRDANLQVSEIVTNEYINNILISTETQTINRTNGIVDKVIITRG